MTNQPNLFQDPINPNLVTVKGIVKKIIFFDPLKDFTIAAMITDDFQEVTFKGNFIAHEKDPLIVRGEWENHPRGRQIKDASISYYTPLNPSELKLYLEKNPKFKGIGDSKSRQLSVYASDFENILFNNPEVFKQNCSCTDNDIAIMQKVWKENDQINVAATRLHGWKLSPKQIEKLLKMFGSTVVAQIEENPYMLIEKVEGYGFLRCDKIARNKGIPIDHPQRIKAAIKYQFKELEKKGHCWISQSDMLGEVSKLATLNYLKDAEKIKEQIQELVEERYIVEDLININGVKTIALAPKKLYECEMWLANLFNTEVRKTNPDKFLNIFPQYSQTLNTKQLLACHNTFNYNLTLTSGYAGTGKTTSLLALIKTLKKAGLSIKLAAPTGKAARRMKDSTDHEATTIHRLLEYSMADNCFKRNANNPLDCDFLAIDEVSMLSSKLAKDLFEAVNFSKTRVLLLGDHNQLCPIQPGNLLRDLINNKTIPTVVLDQIMRNDGALQHNSKAILDGILAPNNTAKETKKRKGLKDWYIQNNYNDANKLKEDLSHFVINRLPQYGLDPLKDIQVISPMKQQHSQLGTFHLNLLLQEKIQKELYGVTVKQVEIKRRKVEKDGEDREEESFTKPNLYLHDKVIQTSNDYSKNLVNGEIGFVCDIFEQMQEDGVLREVIVIDFSNDNEPEKFIEFVNNEDGLKNIELAYALTLHKVQGSEFPCVIMVCVQEHAHMLNRNLFYTGVTRGKELAIVMGNAQGISTAVSKKEIDKRRTFTKYYLKSFNEKDLIQNVCTTTITSSQNENQQAISTITSKREEIKEKSVETQDKESLLSTNPKMENINQFSVPIQTIRKNLATDTIADIFPIWDR